MNVGSRTGAATAVRLVAALALLRQDPHSRRYALQFARSLLPGRSPLDDGVPWLTFGAIAWLNRYLDRHMSVFEYGSGGSTLFIANRAADVISVEHDGDWYARVDQRLRAAGVANCTYLLREPQPEPTDLFRSTDEAYRGLSFESYVRSIESYPDGSFDLVSVDGRARNACVRHALAKVKDGGYILLDDTSRPAYGDTVSTLSAYPRRDFSGIAPYKTDLGRTSVWRIEQGRGGD